MLKQRFAWHIQVPGTFSYKESLHMVQSSKAPTVTGEWECSECGYTEEGIEARRPSKCPECDAPADALEFYTNEEDDWDESDEDLEDEDLELDEADEDIEDEDDDF